MLINTVLDLPKVCLWNFCKEIVRAEVPFLLLHLVANYEIAGFTSCSWGVWL